MKIVIMNNPKNQYTPISNSFVTHLLNIFVFPIQYLYNRNVSSSTLPASQNLLKGFASATFLISAFPLTAISEDFTLRWADNSQNEDGFKIECSTNGGAFEEIDSVPTNTTVYTDYDLEPGTEYSYRVKAYNLSGSSNFSNTATATTALPNSSPMISSIEDQLTYEYEPVGPIGFEVGDAESEASVLIVTAASSNTFLVQNDSISIDGDSAQKSLTILPNPGQTGTTTISLTVSDGIETTTSSFNLLVEATPATESETISLSLEGLQGDLYDFGSNDPFQVLVSGNQSPINSIILYDNGQLVATERYDPYDFAFEANAEGTHVLLIDVVTDLGQYSLTTSVEVAPRPNTPPSIAAISDQRIEENSNLNAISLTVSDAETATSLLSVSATSSNQFLLPDHAINIHFDGQTHTLVATPTLDANGSSTVSVHVSDGHETTATAFTLTVDPNSPPTISALPDLTIEENSNTGPINLSITDAETSADAIEVFVQSSNQDLVDANGISLTGTTSNRTLSITPNNRATGLTTITVTATDGSKSSEQTFSLTVDPNSLPVLSAIADVTINENNPIDQISFTISDAETAWDNLELAVTSSNETLLPNDSIELAGVSGTYQISLSPLAQAYGSTTISLSVSDNLDTTTESFVLTVNPNASPSISSIPDQSIMENGNSSIIPFTIGDAESDSDQLIVTTNSSNSELVEISGIEIGGQGSARHLIISPNGNVNGESIINVTVSDGYKASSSNFLLTVTPNSAPTLSDLESVSVENGQTAGPVPFTIYDLETPAEALMLNVASSDHSVLETSNINIQGTGSNRALSATPSSAGTTIISLTVSDGYKTTTREFTLEVSEPDTDNGGPSIGNIDIAITAPSNGDSVPFDQLTNIEVSLSTYEYVTMVSYLMEGVNIGNSPSYPFSIQTVFLVEGPIQLVAVAHTTDGLEYISEPSIVNVTSPPSTESIEFSEHAQSQTIGHVKSQGSYSYDELADAYLISASGSGIRRTEDSFRYAYVPVIGDAALVARVVDFQAEVKWSRTGVMIRSNLNAESANVMTLLNGYLQSYSQFRLHDNDGTSRTSGPILDSNYLKVERKGGQVICSTSANGDHWNTIKSVNIELPDTYYIGLALASNRNNKLSGVVFDDVQLNGRLAE